MLATIRHQNPLYPVLNDFFGTRFLNDSDWSTSPAVNIAENNNEFKIEVAAPGMSKENFKLNVEKRVLEISAEKETTTEDSEDGTYFRKEFKVESFKRTFALPTYVDTEKIAASYKDGVLYVTVPKKEEVKEKPARAISVE